MKVLFFASDTIPHVGGKSTHILDLADGFNEIGIETEIISLANINTIKKIASKILISPLKFINQETYSFYLQRIWSRVLNKIVYEFCNKNDVDFISVQDAVAASTIEQTAKKIPVILTMHTYFGLENSLDKKMNNLDRKIYDTKLLFELRALGVADSIIAVDNRIKKHIQDTIEQEKKTTNIKVKRVSSIANFTNIAKYSPPEQELKNGYRRKFGLSDNTFVVCCIRRLVEKNGVINAVRAMSYFKNDDIILLIGGNGPQKQLIDRYIVDNKLEKQVKLLGSLDRETVRQIYMASDASIVPSITVNGLQEATSISAIEAMACGLPTIASDIGGLPQLIQNNETGILVDECNIEQIVEAIIKLKNNKELCYYIGRNARKHVMANHSHIEAAKKYLSEFKKCLSN